jgi:hypothetical protein
MYTVNESSTISLLHDEARTKLIVFGKTTHPAAVEKDEPQVFEKVSNFYSGPHIELPQYGIKQD